MLETRSMSSLLETKIAASQHALREQGLLRQRKVLSVDRPLIPTHRLRARVLFSKVAPMSISAVMII